MVALLTLASYEWRPAAAARARRRTRAVDYPPWPPYFPEPPADGSGAVPPPPPLSTSPSAYLYGNQALLLNPNSLGLLAVSMLGLGLEVSPPLPRLPAQELAAQAQWPAALVVPALSAAAMSGGSGSGGPWSDPPEALAAAASFLRAGGNVVVLGGGGGSDSGLGLVEELLAAAAAPWAASAAAAGPGKPRWSSGCEEVQVSDVLLVQAVNEDGSDALPYLEGLPVILLDSTAAFAVRLLACPPSSGALPWYESRSESSGPVAAALVWPVGRGRLVWLGGSFGDIAEAAPWVYVLREAVVAQPRGPAPQPVPAAAGGGGITHPPQPPRLPPPAGAEDASPPPLYGPPPYTTAPPPPYYGNGGGGGPAPYPPPYGGYYWSSPPPPYHGGYAGGGGGYYGAYSPPPPAYGPAPDAPPTLPSFGCLPFVEDGKWDEQVFDAVQVPVYDNENDGGAAQFDPVKCGRAAGAAGYFLAGFVAAETGSGGGGGRCFGLEFPPDGAADLPSAELNVVGGGGACAPCAASPDWAQLWCGGEVVAGGGGNSTTVASTVTYMSIYETFYFDPASD
ncbi:hypothetical protein HYH02_011098 [Chlamydomonas schloesseri]|uniref:Uncharacterized protein n=1 Tax=Chlamydomonas schloesseri TaxID=2026947 RepID=A0A835THA8_9CHLO|nr:hypothetical protein HYH02_011098 [Chlamydomonas schloesseri]|eukprot:KAG2437720.1 hypothetical protein HYH02_011098 [Chlamydomonas schloesseri]